LRIPLTSLFFILACFCINPLCAQEVEKEKAPKDWEDWNFKLSPYFWLVGFNGTLTTPPLPILPTPLPEPEDNSYDIDIGFKDVRNSIKYAMMLSGQYRNQKISVVMNYSHLILEGQAVTPFEILIRGIDFRFRHISGDMSLQYRIVKSEKWNFDAGLGLKFLDEKIESVVNFTFDTSVDLDTTVNWVDPVISALVRFMPHQRVDVVVYTDVGSGLIGDLSYQSMGGIAYRFSRVFSVSIGYRIWGVRKDFGNSILKGNLNGLTTRLGFRF
jgi:hypothetical protein